MTVMDAGIEVVVTRLPPGKDERELLPLLSAEEQRRADRFVSRSDRRRFIGRRASLRRLLGERLNVAPSAIPLSHRARGKPALSPPFDRSGLEFNLSHCDDLVLFALSSCGEIGIDVEALRITPEADRIVATCFSPGEYEAYSTLPATRRSLAFLTWWTRKEALAKAVGDGLADARSAPVDNGERSWQIRTFFPAHGFIAALAHEAAP